MKKTLFFDFFGVFVEETVSKYYQNHHFTKEQQEEGNKVFRQGDLGNILYPEVRKRLGAIDGTSPEDADKEFDTIIKEMTEINESNNSSLGLDDFNDEPDVDDE